MGLLELFFISVGLGMDAFAVSICKGLSMKKINIKKMLIIGLYFGIFQGIMPLIGYLLGLGFYNYIDAIDHYVALVLLVLIGILMIKEALDNNRENTTDNTNFKEMIVLSIATSIDALAVGITLAFLEVRIISSAILITIITFILSVIGVKIGNAFGYRYERNSKIIGGIILIMMGIKIFIEHII